MSDAGRHSKLVTTTVAAVVLGRSERTVARWIRDGRLRAFKRAGRVLIEREELQRALALVPVRVPR